MYAIRSVASGGEGWCPNSVARDGPNIGGGKYCYSEQEMIQNFIDRWVKPGVMSTVGVNDCVNTNPRVVGDYFLPYVSAEHTLLRQSKHVTPEEKKIVWTTTCTYQGKSTSAEDFAGLIRVQTYTCPNGLTPLNWTNDPALASKLCASNQFDQIKLERRMQVSSCPVGHPCHPMTGDKSRAEQDFIFAGRPFVRHYHSLRELVPSAMPMGLGWTHSFAAWTMHPSNLGGVVTANGTFERFLTVGSGNYQLPTRKARFRILADGRYELRSIAGEVEIYSSGGQLLEMRDLDDPRKDVVLSYQTVAGRVQLKTATDVAGRRLLFDYDEDGLLVRIGLPDGLSVLYGYQDSNLVSVDYGNGQIKQYVYGEQGLAPNGDQGLLTGIVSEDGRRYGSFGYDAYSRVISSALHDDAGLTEATQLSYPSQNSAAVQSMTGEVTTYTTNNDRHRKPTSIVSTERSSAATYDYYGRVQSSTDTNGVVTQVTHEASGRRSIQVIGANSTDGSKRTIEEGWEDSLNRISELRVKNATGLLASKDNWSYNARGQVISVSKTDPVTSSVISTTTTYCEDASVCGLVGLPLQIDGPRTDISDALTYSYYLVDDPACTPAANDCLFRKGDLWKVTNAKGQVTETLAYDGAGRAIMAKDANGVLNEYEYGPRGWLLSHRVNGGGATDRVTEFEYWPTGLISGITLPDGGYTGYVYDAAHRLTDVLDGDGNRIHYTLDGAGKRIKEETFGASNTLKRSLSRVYDVLGRMTKERGADGNGPSYSYGPSGNALSTTDAQGVSSTATYDSLNRLTQSLQDVGGIAASTQFEYDALDNLTQVTDPKGLKTTYTYDGLGQLRTTTSPDTGSTQRTYDEAGNVKTSTDARGVTTSYTYDALNRMTSKSYPSQGEDVAYTYDTVPTVCASGEGFAVGRLSSMADGSGRTDYCYNRFGDVVRKAQLTNGKTFVVRYTYTTGGNLASVIYPDGAVADYVRDGQGRITEIGVTSGSSGHQVLLTGASYLPFGPSTGWQYGNGRALVRSFDTDYRPTAVVDSASQLKIGLGYDTTSKIVALESDNYTAGFDYDALGRLKAFRDTTANVAIEQYSYDATGNRLSFGNAGITTPYTYETTSHRLTSVDGVTRSYDAAGNTIGTLSGVKTFDHNQANRLSKVLMGGVAAQSYAYNARGERVQRGLDAASIVYSAYDEAGRWLGDYNSLGNPKQQVIWMDDMPVGLLADGVLHYVEPDHLGTPRLVFNPLRNVPVWTWDIKGEAFGNSVPNQDPDIDDQDFVFDMRFPGQRYDAVSGLNYNYYRDYDPSSGRYVQSDPIGLGGGISTYGYVGGNPMGAIDPSGLIDLKIPGISVSIHANPGPEVTAFRAEHDPPHVHLGSNDGPRISTENFKPLSDKDARRMTREQMRICDSLSDSQKALVRGRQAAVFKYGKYILRAMSMPLVGADSLTNACRSDPIACAQLIEAVGLPEGWD
ncbi:RHS repeat-associated core domain-containing protein [Stenotrophomonas sp. Iso1]|uniref:RHS repeat-associated core domain-containing protein n=1 Tax=Stenotrophomonas sp. Iso1 TaxID=2977283 RepID=UPI0022B795D9|nr:RHS repeat-associated core domain-containing protein [Stenotrophomonas sp. Iso1]